MRGWPIAVDRSQSEKFTLISEFDLSEKAVRSRQRAALTAVGYPCWAAPVLSHGRLYVRGRGRGQGRVVCLDVKGA